MKYPIDKYETGFKDRVESGLKTGADAVKGLKSAPGSMPKHIVGLDAKDTDKNSTEGHKKDKDTNEE